MSSGVRRVYLEHIWMHVGHIGDRTEVKEALEERSTFSFVAVVEDHGG